MSSAPRRRSLRPATISPRFATSAAASRSSPMPRTIAKALLGQLLGGHLVAFRPALARPILQYPRLCPPVVRLTGQGDRLLHKAFGRRNPTHGQVLGSQVVADPRRRRAARRRTPVRSPAARNAAPPSRRPSAGPGCAGPARPACRAARRRRRRPRTRPPPRPVRSRPGRPTAGPAAAARRRRADRSSSSASRARCVAGPARPPGRRSAAPVANRAGAQLPPATNRIPPATALPDKRQPLPALAMALEDGA